MTIAIPDNTADTVKRDRYGRYVLVHPLTGKEQAWTRVTTFADTLDDRYNLERWKLRQAALGLARRPDLIMGAASAKPEDKHDLNKIVDQAMEAAASSSGANLGIALHRFTEQVDRGETVAVPAPYDADIDAYRTTLAAHRLEIVPGMIERIVCILDLGLCGTFDRLVDYDGPTIADVKTGAGIDYAMGSIALQLACYAHASHWWDGTMWHDMPTCDLSTALVIHLPAGKATCDLIEVDIASGWEAAERAAWVRGWRKRKDLHRRVERPATAAVVDPFVGLPGNEPPTPATLRARLAALDADTAAAFRAQWAWPKLDDCTAGDLAAIEAELNRATGGPFLPIEQTRPTPTHPVAHPPDTVRTEWERPDEGGDIAPGTVEALRAAIGRLEATQQAMVRSWLTEAQTAGRRVGRVGDDGKVAHTVRSFEQVRAAMTLAAAWHDLGDDGARLYLAAAIGDPDTEQTATTIGTAIGTLTTDEARRLAAAIEGHLTGTPTLRFDDAGTPVLAGA